MQLYFTHGQTSAHHNWSFNINFIKSTSTETEETPVDLSQKINNRIHLFLKKRRQHLTMHGTQ